MDFGVKGERDEEFEEMLAPAWVKIVEGSIAQGEGVELSDEK